MAQRLAIALLVGLVATGCSKGPLDPSENTSDRFSGTVQPGSIGEPVAHFNVPRLGEFSVMVTALTPGGAFPGIGWGQWNGAGCGLTGQTNVVTTVGRTVLSGQIYTKGDYCVVVFDGTNLGAPPLTVAQNYTIQVSHP
ncbi:MAG: hypothetical protein ABI868_06775 [Acidobacteriota bacterium]